MNGRVYWITGLSNSGKTTIGTALYYDLKKKGKNVVILDGDLLKAISSGSEEVAYTENDRRIRARRYSMMSKLLADQGLWVIVCTRAMFDDIREWNRKNIRGYIEIFLDVPMEVLKKRDRKGLMTVNDNVQFPKTPDLVVNNDGGTGIRDIVARIEDIVPGSEDDYDRDREYWNRYYKDIIDHKVVPSDFARLVETKLERNSHIMELGCGNGRDSLYFLSQGHNVIAVDGADAAIDMLNEVTKEDTNALFVCDDFVKCQTLYQMKYDCIYSRFTLHAITEEQENELLSNVKQALIDGGLLCIEARTIHDEIYGKGKKVEHNAFYYNDHYRRFIDIAEFEDKLKKNGFKILSIEESAGFSKTEESDPVLMRCIASL